MSTSPIVHLWASQIFDFMSAPGVFRVLVPVMRYKVVEKPKPTLQDLLSNPFKKAVEKPKMFIDTADDYQPIVQGRLANNYPEEPLNFYPGIRLEEICKAIEGHLHCLDVAGHWEVALGLTWSVFFDNGSVAALPCWTAWDCRPDFKPQDLIGRQKALGRLCKVFKTANSYHIYCKSLSKLSWPLAVPNINDLKTIKALRRVSQDAGWTNVSTIHGGYLRISEGNKGPIVPVDAA